MSWEGLLRGRVQRKVEVIFIVWSAEKTACLTLPKILLGGGKLFYFVNHSQVSWMPLGVLGFFLSLARTTGIFCGSSLFSPHLTSTPQGCIQLQYTTEARWYKQNKTCHGLCFKFTSMSVCTSCVPMQMGDASKQERNICLALQLSQWHFSLFSAFVFHEFYFKVAFFC